MEATFNMLFVLVMILEMNYARILCCLSKTYDLTEVFLFHHREGVQLVLRFGSEFKIRHTSSQCRFEIVFFLPDWTCRNKCRLDWNYI